MTTMDFIEAYHALRKIEESFRIMKNTLEIQPVYHWSPKRVRSHFVVCFRAFLMERKMELLLKNEKDDIVASPDKIQDALNMMQLAAVEVNGEETYIKVKPNPLCNKIFKLLKLHLPLNGHAQRKVIQNGSKRSVQIDPL